MIITHLLNQIYKLLSSKSKNEDIQRKESILNILLLSSIVLVALANILIIRDLIFLKSAYRGSPLEFFLTIFFSFCFLYILSKNGLQRLSSYIFILIYFLITLYASYKWGANLPAGLLSYAIIIIMAGILISSLFSFIMTIIISASLIFITYLHINSVVEPVLYWKTETLKISDVVVFSSILFVIAIISWLSNREIEKSLRRARKSEAELKKERDMLEIKIEERTRELKEMQMEKIAQLYRNAEFGRLASGIFHDLMNPLTAVSLSLEQIQNSSQAEKIGGEIVGIMSYLYQAIDVSKKLENFIMAIKKQLSNQEKKCIFSLTEEIIQIIQILSYKARKCGVELNFPAMVNIKNFGDQIKFSQIIINLISNAIDSYEGINCVNSNKSVDISLYEKDGIIYLTIEDNGCGIAPDNLEKIFNPFFTTKSFDKGTGIGLSSTKRIIEKNFGGSIEFESKQRFGTRFIIKLPMNITLRKRSDFGV